MISKKEVEHIAKLARIELEEKELEKMQKDLSAILDYFDLLKKAPKAKRLVEVNYKAKAHLRKDESKQSNLADEIIADAPGQQDGYIKVRSVL